MASYAERVKRDIERWRGAGWITPELAETLGRDVEAQARQSRFNLGNVIAILAAILLGAAVLLAVASNWEAIPRLARVAALLALVAGGTIGGALLKESRAELFGDGLYLLGAAAFGGSLALIGQMYHLSGDEAAAILIWCIAVALAAAALRSGVLTIAAVAIGFAWFSMQVGVFFVSKPFPYAYPVLALCLWAVSVWTGSTAARHLLILSLVGYAFTLALLGDDGLWVGAVLALAAAALFLAAVHVPDLTRGTTGLGFGLAADALIAFWFGIGVVQAETIDTRAAIPLGAIALAGFVGAVVLAGPRSRLVRWLAYAGFAGELCFLYVATVGSMLDTAGLFLAAGLALGLLAWVVVRLERRIRSGGAMGAAV